MDENTGLSKELQPGTALNSGKYVIEKKIGEGGFGITYKAVQQGLNRYVCIKEYFLAGRCVRNTHNLTIQLQGVDEEVFERFREAFVKEAQTLASLHHTNIVEVIDIFNENNTSYMVMSFIEGRSLQTIVEGQGPLSYPEAVNYIAQVTSAVDYIHERHVLHRDIKPENIMITDDYKAILIDFGSAREFQQDKTQRHTSLITHGYAPPEQYSANSRKGAYTDIYALGASLYYILTGHVPLEAAARLTEELTEPKVFNPKIPEEANRTIMKAMQLKVIDRYQTVREFMDDLRNKQSTVPTDVSDEAKGTSVMPQKQDDKKDKPWLKWVLIAVIIILILAFGAYVLMHNQKELKAPISVSDSKSGEMRGLAISNSRLISPGDNYSAEIVLASFDAKSTPEVYYKLGVDTLTESQLDGATRLEGKNGSVKLELSAGDFGEQRYAGLIKVKAPDGSDRYYPFSDRYMVVKPSATISAEKMNVLYAGIANPVSVSASVDPDKLSVNFPGCTVSRVGSGKFNVNVPTSLISSKTLVATVNANVGGKTQSMGSANFRIKRVPDPTSTIGAKIRGGKISKAELNTNAFIRASMGEDFAYDLKWSIISYQVIFIPKGGYEEAPITCTGGNFSEAVKSKIAKSPSGTTIIFQGLKASSEVGTRPLDDITIVLR